MSKHPQWIEDAGLVVDIDGEPYVTMAGILLATLEVMHTTSPDSENHQRASKSVGALLAAAYEYGFPRNDLVHVLIARGERAGEVIELAKAAMDRVPKHRIEAAMHEAGIFSI
ncbi:hypothetical protein [Pandoraea soli]